MNLKSHKIMALILILCVASSNANTTTQKQAKKPRWELVTTAGLSISAGTIIGTILFNRFFKPNYGVNFFVLDRNNSNLDNLDFLTYNANVRIEQLENDASAGWAIKEYALIIRRQNITGNNEVRIL